MNMTVSDDVRASMQETNERFCYEVVGQGMFDALDEIYTKKAWILPPGATMVEGLDAIKAFWKVGTTALGIKRAILTTIYAEMAGGTIVEIGTAELELEENAATAKYMCSRISSESRPSNLLPSLYSRLANWLLRSHFFSRVAPS
jgi:hypothetical protein